jgi:magnesium-transporting ATPase (P-type)
MEQSINNCKSCGEPLSGIYCSQCGQKTITERYTFRRIFNNLLSTIFNFEKGFIFTIKQLFKEPGELIRNYLNGQTIRYYNPFRYIFIMATVSVVIGLLLGIYDSQSETMNDLLGVNQNDEDLARQAKLMETIKPYMNLFVVFIIPFISLVSYWLFKKKGYNLAEHMVGNSFLLAQTVFIGLFIFPIYIIFPELIDSAVFFGLTLTSIYFSFAYSKWFDLKPVTAIFKAILTIIFGYLFMFIGIAIISIIIAVAYALIQKFFFS